MNNFSKIIGEIKKSITLALPLLFSEWLFAINFFMLVWVTAKLGTQSLAAMALAQSINFFLMMMISGISAAVAILVSQDLGRDNPDGVKYAFAQGVLLTALLAIVASVVLWNAHYFLQYFGVKDQQVILLTKIALHAYIWCTWPMAFLIMFEKFLIGMHRTRLVLLLTSCSIPISIIANYAFVLGKFGLPKFGLSGFGYGLAIAYIILDCLFIILALRLPSLRVYKLFSGFKYIVSEFKYFVETWRIGWPLGAMFSVEVGAVTAFTLLMSLFGTEALAAYQMTRQYLVFALVTLFALTESSAVRVGFAVGQNDCNLVKRSFYVNIGIAVACMMILSCVYVFAHKLLINFDIDIYDPHNAKLLAYVSQFFIAIAILVLFDGVRNIAAGGLRGLKDTKWNMYSSIIGYWIIGLPLAYVFGKVFGFGAIGLWVGFVGGVMISAIILLLRFQKLISNVDLRKLLIS